MTEIVRHLISNDHGELTAICALWADGGTAVQTLVRYWNQIKLGMR